MINLYTDSMQAPLPGTEYVFPYRLTDTAYTKAGDVVWVPTEDGSKQYTVLWGITPDTKKETSCIPLHWPGIMLQGEEGQTQAQHVYRTKREADFHLAVFTQFTALLTVRPYEVFRRQYYIRRRKHMVTVKFRPENYRTEYTTIKAVLSAQCSTYLGKAIYAFKHTEDAIIFYVENDKPLVLKGTTNALHMWLNGHSYAEVQNEAVFLLGWLGFHTDRDSIKRGVVQYRTTVE